MELGSARFHHRQRHNLCCSGWPTTGGELRWNEQLRPKHSRPPGKSTRRGGCSRAGCTAQHIIVYNLVANTDVRIAVAGGMRGLMLGNLVTVCGLDIAFVAQLTPYKPQLNFLLLYWVI